MRINNINICKTINPDAYFKHTSWHDQVVEAKGSELKSLLGEPNTKNGREIQYFLLFITTNGYRAITLYNNYRGNDKNRFTKFHIGGDCKEETVIAAECLSTALTYLRAKQIKWKHAPKKCKCNINGCFPCQHCFSFKEDENRVLCGKVSNVCSLI